MKLLDYADGKLSEDGIIMAGEERDNSVARRIAFDTPPAVIVDLRTAAIGIVGTNHNIIDRFPVILACQKI